MTNEPKTIAIDDDLGLKAVAKEVSTDKEPRLLEVEGRPVAAIVCLDDLEKLQAPPSIDRIERALAAAGAWHDLDADGLIDAIYRARHESPPSAPFTL